MSVPSEAGDIPGFVWLVKRVGPSVAMRLHARFGPALSREDIEDCLAEAFAYLWKRCAADSGSETPADTRLYIIARSKALDRLRKKSRRPKEILLPPGEADTFPARETSPPDTDHDSRKLLDDLEDILAKLSDVDRDIILSFASAKDERAWTHILEKATGMPANTLRVRKSRILRSIREQLIHKGHRPS
jgi:RNA polymerase sigma factor (sigma-70 family)